MSAHYLDIPRDYCEPLGRLRWSALADAVESHDGRTFALTPQLLAFLEGFAAQRPLIHFGHVLHFFYLLRQRKDTHHNFTTLAMAWEEAGRPSRTAGVVCALLCSEMPVAVNPPPLEELAGWLNVWARVSVRPVMPGDEPIMDGDTFEGLLGVELEAYSFRELVHWFRHGQPSAEDQGEAVAEGLLADKPLSLSEFLAKVSRHDRLSGAVPFVDTLVGAISLPPRRHAEPLVAIGGFADVTTKGRPEAILPSQFALDEWEFLRRFAQNELLYYRREDPAVRTREELVVLLDQGVRTWGRVRVLLAAAVFALARMAERRELSLRLAMTSTGGVSCDPRAIRPDDLAETLGQSDLTATPAKALEAFAREPADGPRDVVLLTHPRNLDEPDVIAACAAVSKSSRLFALTADAGGRVELGEVRPGGVVAISRFRVDLTEMATTPPKPVPASSWTGDVEPIGFPFRCGLAGYHEPLSFAFDYEGENLLVASNQEMLLLMPTGGGPHQILPRPMHDGKPISRFTGVIGVKGGFVVTATTRDGERGMSAPVMAYYHRESRTCRVFPIDLEVRPDLRWLYISGEHAIAVMSGARGCRVCLSGDGKEERLPDTLQWRKPGPGTPERQPMQGCEIIAQDQKGVSFHLPVLLLNRQQGELSFEGPWIGWDPFTPLEEGVPVLRGHSLRAGQVQGCTMAALLLDPASQAYLRIFLDGPGSRAIGSLQLSSGREQFTLSQDGRLLAVQLGSGQIQVRNVVPGLGIRCVTPLGRFHNNLVVDLGGTSLRVIIGQTTHLIDWSQGRLACFNVRTPNAAEICRELEAGLLTRATAQPRRPKAFGDDTVRFRTSARRGSVAAVVTGLGEVFVFHEETLVAAFFVFRQELAAWMPDGTRFGAESFGGPATPGAAGLIGEALLNATKGRQK